MAATAAAPAVRDGGAHAVNGVVVGHRATGPSEATTKSYGRDGESLPDPVSKSPVAVRVVGMTRTTGSAGQKEPVVAEYLLYFNQQWVGDHSEDWFRGRGPLAMATVDEMKAAGVYVFAGGLEEEDGPVCRPTPSAPGCACTAARGGAGVWPALGGGAGGAAPRSGGGEVGFPGI